MTAKLRIGSFNLENLALAPAEGVTFEDRVQALRPHLMRMAADILCLQEINAKGGHGHPRSLAALDGLITGTPYAEFNRAVTTNNAGDKPRDVHNLAILSRYPITEFTQIHHQLVAPPHVDPITASPKPETAQAVTWDRPVLHAAIRVGDERLDVFNLHLRAPLAAAVAGQKQAPFVWKSTQGWAEGFFLAAVKRAGQAFETRLAVDALFDKDEAALIAVCGDFNADLTETPLRMLIADVEDTGNGALAARALRPLEINLPDSSRFTVRHFGRRQMLDHVLVSRALLSRFRSIEIHNELLEDELIAYATARHDPDSYHAPVVAGFDWGDEG
jgi:endonuclease/exonuclease/phosphatase family metal-dependent hydrolase